MTPDLLPAPVRGELISDDAMEKFWRMANAFAKGRMFRDVTQAEQAFSKMLVGYYLGLNPTQSMMGIQLIRGNVGMSYPTMGAFVRSRPGYDYKILEHTNERAKIEFFHNDASLGTATFSVEDAKRAKLIRSDGGWETYPENMCVARALSKGIRFFMPEVLGGIPVYTTEEIPDATAEELSSGEGTGELLGLELSQPILDAMERAQGLGHAGLSDRAYWEAQVSRADVSVEEKVREANEKLDALEARKAQRESDIPIEDAGLPEPPARRASAIVNDPDASWGNQPAERRRSDAKVIAEAREAGSLAYDEEILARLRQENLGGGSAHADDAPADASAPGVDGPAEPAAQDQEKRRTWSTDELLEEFAPESTDLAELRAMRKTYQDREARTEEEQAEKEWLLDGVDRQLEELARREADDNPNQERLV